MGKKANTKMAGALLKVGIPYTIAGIVIVFAGLYGLKSYFAQSEYLTAILFIWLALFWFIYQPLFKRQVTKAKLLAQKH